MSTWTNERHEDARRALEEDMSQWGTEYGDAAPVEVDALPGSARGDAGFGSTGRN